MKTASDGHLAIYVAGQKIQRKDFMVNFIYLVFLSY